MMAANKWNRKRNRKYRREVEAKLIATEAVKYYLAGASLQDSLIQALISNVIGKYIEKLGPLEDHR